MDQGKALKKDHHEKMSRGYKAQPELVDPNQEGGCFLWHDCLVSMRPSAFQLKKNRGLIFKEVFLTHFSCLVLLTGQLQFHRHDLASAGYKQFS